MTSHDTSDDRVLQFDDAQLQKFGTTLKNIL
jgi:hypothetical protein